MNIRFFIIVGLFAGIPPLQAAKKAQKVLYVFDAKKHAENFWMSNYFPASVTLTIDGKLYRFASARAAFEAGFYAPPYAKKADHAKLQALADAPDAYTAAAMGEKNPCPNCFVSKNGKKSVIVDWMTTVVRAKFEQHNDLRAKLVATGDAQLVEDCVDMFWGAARGGKNWFGQVLMDVRSQLKKH